MRIALIIFLITAGLPELMGQALWVRPEKYFYNQNEVARIEIVEGADFIAVPASDPGVGIESLELFHRNGRTDIRRNFTGGDKPFYSVNLVTDGIYQTLLVLNPINFSYTKSDFLEYARQYGFEEIYQNSASLKSDSVSVNLRQVIKCYVRVGEQVDRRPEQPRNIAVEVIPDKNPLFLNRGEKITFTILKNGMPAFGVRVKIWNRWNNRTTVQNIYTLKDGTVSTTISSPGDWMVSVVDLKSSGQNQFDGHSFNLVFGFR
jgi:hypothetical protein